MDNSFWKRIASFWVSVRSAEDRKKTEKTIDELFSDAKNKRRAEKDLIDDLLAGFDEEEDDD